MKNFILLLLFFISVACYSQSITLKPLGTMDQPYPIINFLPKTENDSNTYVTNSFFNYTFYLDNTTYNKLFDYIEKYNSDPENLNLSYFPGGTYSINYTNTNSETTTKIVMGHKKSEQFFRKIKKLTRKHNEELKSELSYLINRLK